MNWDALQAVAELGGAVGVLISLVYLAVQIRQNTASVQSAAVSRASEILNRTRNRLWEDPEAVRIYLLALSGVRVEDVEDAARARLLFVALARDYEAIFHQKMAGQLPEGMWEGWRKEMLAIFTTSGGRDALEALSDNILSDAFATFLRAEVDATDSSTMSLLRAKWDEAGERRREEQA